jgi:hypothetical protein
MRINEVLKYEVFEKNGKANDNFAKIEGRCSDALEACSNGKMIFRGTRINTLPVMLVDPSASQRKSANTENYYTLLIDNLPSWQNYPKRSKSLICSTSRHVAELFSQDNDKNGGVYIVLPFNGAKIGICPQRDIWLTNIQGRRMYEWNRIYSSYGISDSSYQSMIRDMHYDGLAASIFNNDINIKTDAEMIVYLDEMYDPVNLGFSVVPIEGLPEASNDPRELWTDSKCYLINVKAKEYINILRSKYGNGLLNNIGND